MANILITGADKGLGLALVKAYLAQGDTVVACALDPDAATGLRATQARILKMDVTRPDDIAQVKSDLGGWPIDILLNNAGVTGYGSIGALDYDVFQTAVETNLYGPLRVTEALAGNVAASGLKMIATISSGLASIADRSYTAALPYRASKAGLNMAMRCAAEDYAPRGITMLVLHPGHVKSDMGGPHATVDAADSAAGLRTVIAEAGPSDELRFFDYLGNSVAW